MRILLIITLLFLGGCAHKMSSKTMLASPFTSAEFETGGKINAAMPEVLIK